MTAFAYRLGYLGNLLRYLDPICGSKYYTNFISKLYDLFPERKVGLTARLSPTIFWIEIAFVISAPDLFIAQIPVFQELLFSS